MSQISTFIRFTRDVRAEVSRITWPSFAETRRLTVMVGILVVIVSLFLLAVDMLIGAGLSAIFGFKF